MRPWRPSRPVTILLGALSLWPILYFFFFLVFIVYSFGWMSRGGGAERTFPAAFQYVFLAHIVTMVLMFALTAVYVVHVFRTDRLASDRRVLWGIVLILGNVIAFPIYWYLYLWRDSAPSARVICRIWHGWTTPSNAAAYQKLLEEEIFAGIRARRIRGFQGIDLLRRAAGAEVEFVTIMWFDDLSAVREFAGDDYEVAVVPPAARELLARFEERSAHYEVVQR